MKIVTAVGYILARLTKREKQLVKGRDLYSPQSPSYPINEDTNPHEGRDRNWYWFDTFEEAHGPYDTEILASEALVIYGLGHDHGRALGYLEAKEKRELPSRFNKV